MSGLPSGWVDVEVREVVQPTENCDPTNEGDLPFRYVDIGSINNKTFSIEHPKSLLGRDAPSRAKRRIRRGDVLFSTVRTYLKNIAVVPDDLDGEITSTGIAVLRPSDAILSAFLFALVRSEGFVRPLSLKQDGTLYPAITDSDLLNHQIPLPPVAEQKRIVAKLAALNAKSARARTELARIETLVSRYKQAVLSKAFSGELTSAEVSNWALCTLGGLALDVRYGTAAKCTYAPDLTPVLRIPNVANGRIDLLDLKHASFNEKEIRKLALNKGDLLVIRSNGSLDLVGRSAVVDSEAAGMLFAGYLIRIRLDLSKALPPFIQCWMQSFAVRRTIEDAAKSTSGVNNVNSQQLQALQLHLPPLEEQHEIVRHIESAFAKIDRLAKEAKRALELVGRLDEAILSKAFRGKLVPQDENDEPASILLARIRQDRESQPAEAKRKAPTRQRKVPDMARTILETLIQTKDWLSAQELFARCGVRDGSSTEDVENLYRQLLELERQERVEIEEVVDLSTGAKQGDRVRLRK
ncbi:restriction endonuclease subunit S [Rhizobium ruizarguesonis]